MDEDIVTAMGLALAAIASLVERTEPIPPGEVGRCLHLLAETASPDRPAQKAILAKWAQLLKDLRERREQAFWNEVS